MRKSTGPGSKKIRGSLAHIPAPTDLPPEFRRRRFRVRLFGTDERTEAPEHPRGWYMVARSLKTATYALVDENEQVIAQVSKIPMESFESGAPHPAIVDALEAFARPIVFAHLESPRRPLVGYIGWLGTEGRGPSHVDYPVRDGTTTLTTSARVSYGPVDDIRKLEGELTVYRALDGEPTTDKSFTLNLGPDATIGRIDIQLPIDAAGAFLKLVNALVAAGRRDGLLPTED